MDHSSRKRMKHSKKRKKSRFFWILKKKKRKNVFSNYDMDQKSFSIYELYCTTSGTKRRRKRCSRRWTATQSKNHTKADNSNGIGWYGPDLTGIVGPGDLVQSACNLQCNHGYDDSVRRSTKCRNCKDNLRNQ